MMPNLSRNRPGVILSKEQLWLRSLGEEGGCALVSPALLLSSDAIRALQRHGLVTITSAQEDGWHRIALTEEGRRAL